jgi:multiple sugar transport system permease protein
MKQTTWVQSTRYLALAVVVLLTLFPIIWIVLTAFKDQQEVTKIPPSLFVTAPTLDNFWQAMEAQFPVALRNSLIVGLGSTLVAMILSVPAAYAFARHPFPGSRALLLTMLIVRMVPGIALVIPFFKMMDSLGLLNNDTALIITYLSFQIPFAVWLLEGFFRALPRELEESALVDGCTRFRAFRSIVLPLAAVGLATAAIFCFIMSWNEFLYAVTLTRTLDAKTGPVAIAEAVTSYQIFWGRMAASATIYVLPVLLFNFFFQRFIVRGLTLGAVKG